MMDDAGLTGLLRDSVDGQTAGVRVPSGLVGRAWRRHRRRRVALRAGGAATAATAAVAVGLTAAAPGPGSSNSPRGTAPGEGGPGSGRGTAAGLTAVHGCPGKYIAAGTVERVSGTQLILQPANDHDHHDRAWQALPVTVATSPSTLITRPAGGTVGDITDGSHVSVQGTWSGRRLAATQVGIEVALPSPGSFGPPIGRHLPGGLVPKGAPARLVSPGERETGQSRAGAIPPFVNGTVTGAHDGSFTVVTHNLIPGVVQRARVVTSQSTRVLAQARISLSQLHPGANVVVVGQFGSHRVLTASTVTEPSVMHIVLAAGPAKIRPSGCSASAITSAAVLPGG